jgi:hypothetical protein
MADQPQNPYFRPDVVTPEEELRRNFIALEQVKTYLASAKVGSADYNRYKASYDAINARIKELNKTTEATRTAAQQKETSAKRKKLVDAVTRANDYGTEKEKQSAQKALDDFDGKNPGAATGGGQAELRYGPNGESLVPGTKAYEQGSTVRPPASITAASQTPPKTGDKTKSKITPPPGTTDDVKMAYISALRETIKSLPPKDNLEVTKLLDMASKSNMDEKAFMAELEKTNWWQSSLPSMQAYFIESHDPRNKGTFAQKLQTQTDKIMANLEVLGIQATQVDPVTGKFYDNTKVIQGIASMAMMNGWDDNQLKSHLAETAQLHFTGGGTIGSTIDNLKLNAMKYGVSIDDNYLKQIQFSLLDPTDGRDSQYYINEMKNQAMDMYKPFADQIKNGRTLYEVTNNYRTKMANLLEVDPSTLSWKDLMGKVVDPTTGVARMESDFLKQVKQDPLWQYTKNAKETYSNMALDLMKQFGFVG